MKDSDVEVGFSVTGSFWVDPERFTVEKDADGNVVALVPKLYGGATAKYRLTLAIEIEDNPERFRVIYSEKTMAEESDQEEDSEVSDGDDENNLYDLMADFFANENGDNVAMVLTNIQNSIDQNSKCLLKLTKVIQEFVTVYSKKN